MLKEDVTNLKQINASILSPHSAPSITSVDHSSWPKNFTSYLLWLSIPLIKHYFKGNVSI